MGVIRPAVFYKVLRLSGVTVQSQLATNETAIEA
jgi:hypothetical protein